MSDFWTKAQSATKSAGQLLNAGDADGAVNRAYYGMLFGARIMLERVDPKAANAKRHSTIVSQFGLHFVRGRRVDVAHGRAFKLALEQRLIADYQPENVEMTLAREVVNNAAAFLEAVRRLKEENTP